jgi:site-specific DNA-adenine methylase
MNLKTPMSYTGKKKGLVVETLRDCYQKLSDPTWIEPFVGGGGSLLGVQPNRAITSDKSTLLINTWEEIQNGLNASQINWEQSKEGYLSNRQRFNQMLMNQSQGIPVDKNLLATLFCYLMLNSWGGVIRFSSKGFNVPFGHKKVTRTNEDYNSWKEILKDYQFHGLSFEEFHKKLQLYQDTCQLNPHNCIVYLDPPYAEDKSDKYIFHMNNKEREKMIDLYSEYPFVAASDNPVEWVINKYKSAGFNVYLLDSKRGLGKNRRPGTQKEMLALKGFPLIENNSFLLL